MQVNTFYSIFHFKISFLRIVSVFVMQKETCSILLYSLESSLPVGGWLKSTYNWPAHTHHLSLSSADTSSNSGCTCELSL